jgi:hypothetical protein
VGLGLWGLVLSFLLEVVPMFKFASPVLAVLIAGCAQGVTPTSAWTNLLADVKAGVAMGDSLPQLEAIVARDVNSDINPTVDIILNDVLDVIEEAATVANALESDRAVASKSVVVHKVLKVKLATIKVDEAAGKWP